MSFEVPFWIATKRSRWNVGDSVVVALEMCCGVSGDDCLCFCLSAMICNMHFARNEFLDAIRLTQHSVA